MEKGASCLRVWLRSQTRSDKVSVQGGDAEIAELSAEKQRPALPFSPDTHPWWERLQPVNPSKARTFLFFSARTHPWSGLSGCHAPIPGGILRRFPNSIPPRRRRGISSAGAVLAEYVTVFAKRCTNSPFQKFANVSKHRLRRGGAYFSLPRPLAGAPQSEPRP